MTFYLEPRLERLGFCGRTAFKAPDIYVASGFTNGYDHDRGHHPHDAVIQMSYRNFQAVGGAQVLADFTKLKTDYARIGFVVNTILKNVTPSQFANMLTSTFEQGRVEGIRANQCQMRKALGLECETS